MGKGGAWELAEFSEQENGALFTSLRRDKHRARLAAERRIIGQKPKPTFMKGAIIIKSKRITLRVSESHWQKLHNKSEAAGMTLTDYLTACGLQKEIVIIDGLDEVIRQQKGVGRNLNQLTTLANMGKVNVVYLRELTDAYAQVSFLLSEILKRKRWS